MKSAPSRYAPLIWQPLRPSRFLTAFYPIYGVGHAIASVRDLQLCGALGARHDLQSRSHPGPSRTPRACRGGNDARHGISRQERPCVWGDRRHVCFPSALRRREAGLGALEGAADCCRSCTFNWADCAVSGTGPPDECTKLDVPSFTAGSRAGRASHAVPKSGLAAPRARARYVALRRPCMCFSRHLGPGPRM